LIPLAIALLAATVATASPSLGHPTPPPPVTIRLAHGDPMERETQAQLETLLKRFDLSDWLFTRSILIQAYAVPHDYPVLTLNTRHRQDLTLLLSSLLHEELHRFISAHPAQVEAAVRDLKKAFPKVPVGFPDGADSEEAGYEHLLINYLEIEGVAMLMGQSEADRALKHWEQDHYRWIYRTVRQSPGPIRDVINRHRLWPPGLLPPIPPEQGGC
jgi:hypothetical protein